MQKLRLSQSLMVATILLIVAFQSYWLMKLYNDEWKVIKKETDVVFRETIYKLQVTRFKKDTLIFRRFSNDNLFGFQAVNAIRKKIIHDTVQTQPSPKAAFIKIVTTDSIDAPEKGQLANSKNRILFDNLDTANKANTQSKVVFRVYNKNSFNNGAPTLSDIDSIAKIAVKRISDSSLSFEQGLPGLRSLNTNNIKAIEVVRNRVKEQNIKTPILVTKSPTIKNKSENPFYENRIKIITQDSLLNDSLPINQIDSVYSKELLKAGIHVPYVINHGTSATKDKAKPRENELKTNPASVGLLSPFYYQAVFENPFSFILKKISPQIILSLLLVAFTTISFVVLYRNLINQRRLAEIKNDFISNITHELKTPIATVNVAIEAMRNFNALQDPARTKEYLDISAIELQRLSLLVDKVLRLSMFEKKEIELKKEWFSLGDLVKEVMASMRLQFEKHKAKVNLQMSGESTGIQADKLHIISVVYNLIDNALKYSNTKPVIDIDIKDESDLVQISFADNGVGIGPEYHNKIFEKFFRVPAQDTHNIKGYGLGLSYVCHIIHQHNGTINVESEPGIGSRFIIRLPK